MSFLRTIEIINKIPLMMYRKILNYKHIFDIRSLQIKSQG